MRIFETLQERNALSSLVVGVVAFLSFSLSLSCSIYASSAAFTCGFFIRFLVHEYPQSHPDETQSADNGKSHFPAVAHAHALEVAGQGRDTQWGYQCSDGRAGIEYGSGEGTVFLWKYSAVTLMAAGKFPASPNAQYDTGGNEVVNAGDG